jgi:hypothetical protein
LARQGPRAFQGLRVCLAPKDPLVLLGRQGPMDHRAHQGLRGRLHRAGNLDLPGLLGPRDLPGLLDRRGRKGSQVIRGRKGHKVLLAPEGKLAQPGYPDQLALLVRRDPRDKQDHPVLRALRVP